MKNIIINRINQAEAKRYMGYKGSEPDDNAQQIIDECEKNLIACIKPRFVYAVFDLSFHHDYVEPVGTTLKFYGEDIRRHLENCSQCVLLCATISEGADRLIRREESSDMACAVMTDALASSAIEQVCNEVEKIIRNQLEDKFFTWRFSAGYGDFPLDIQEDFVKCLNAQKRIGLSCTADNILIPRKSVTAVIGVSDSEIAKGRRGCATCNMAGRCELRKRGEHCGF